jgi:hypothetical protein
LTKRQYRMLRPVTMENVRCVQEAAWHGDCISLRMNTPYGFHESSRVAVIILLLIAFSALVGCANPFADEEQGPTGTAPTISHVNLYRYNSSTGYFEASFSFAIGEIAYVEVFVNDPDLDIASLTGRTTHVSTGNSDTSTIGAEPQSAADTVYVGAWEIIGPTGTWNADFWMTDSAGNTSNEYRRVVTVTN